MNTIKGCPFCNSKAEVKQATGRFFPFYIVACSRCGAHTREHTSPEGAIESWNTRSKEYDNCTNAAAGQEDPDGQGVS